MVQELINGAMAAADAAAAAVAADSEAARRKERTEHKRQRKRHRDRASHNQRTNKRKNLRRSEGRKARARTRAQMAPVLSQLSHLTRSRLAVEPRLSKQARSRIPLDADLHICATNELSPSSLVMPGKRHAKDLLAERASDCATRSDSEEEGDRGAQRSNLLPFPPHPPPLLRPPLSLLLLPTQQRTSDRVHACAGR
jgi:hypothetical protein